VVPELSMAVGPAPRAAGSQASNGSGH
jgi:hypothetical protein